MGPEQRAIARSDVRQRPFAKAMVGPNERTVEVPLLAGGSDLN